MITEINYEAIRKLNANGYNVESEDGQVWRIVTNYKQRLAISYHINHNGTMSGPYNPDGTKQKRN